MRSLIGEARWAALRALREGEPPTFPLLALACDINVATVRERASLEGWKKQPFRSSRARRDWPGRGAAAFGDGAGEAMPAGWQAMQPGERLHWLNDFVSRQLGQIAASAESGGGTLDKARVDALWSMIRMVERSGSLARDSGSSNETDDDAELAAKLRLLDDRIVELARAHAKWLVANQSRP